MAGMVQPLPSAEAVQAVVLACLNDLLADRGAAQAGVSGATEVFGGPGAVLDSMGLVNLIADLEARVEVAFVASLVLADERAMSRSRSPFRTVDTITAHVLEQMTGGAA
jgi:acyl carrier protein